MKVQGGQAAVDTFDVHRPASSQLGIWIANKHLRRRAESTEQPTDSKGSKCLAIYRNILSNPWALAAIDFGRVASSQHDLFNLKAA